MAGCLCGDVRMKLLVTVVALVVSVTCVDGQYCTLGAVSYCSEVCTKELDNTGVGEVRFSGVVLFGRCLPPHVKVRLSQDRKNKDSTNVQTLKYRCRMFFVLLAS